MNNNDFFDFSSKLRSTTFQAAPIFITDNSEKNPPFHRRLIVGDYEGVSFPIQFKYDSGKKMCDVLDTGYHCLYLISDSLRLCLKENFLTGWQTFPITLLDKNDNQIEGYHGFSVLGRSGPIDYSSSEIITKTFYEGGPSKKYYKGCQITDLDGSDFFVPKNAFCIVVTSRTANLMKQKKFTNISLTNLAEEETPEDAALLATERTLNENWIL